MLGLWRLNALVAGFFLLCVVDLGFEIGLIVLLRQRHHAFWKELGSPKPSFWGYIKNSFNGRGYIASQAVRERHDEMLESYCWVFRVFNFAFLLYLPLTMVVILLSAGQYFLAR
jgi:hypothetical protein